MYRYLMPIVWSSFTKNSHYLDSHGIMEHHTENVLNWYQICYGIAQLLSPSTGCLVEVVRFGPNGLVLEPWSWWQRSFSLDKEHNTSLGDKIEYKMTFIYAIVLIHLPATQADAYGVVFYVSLFCGGHSWWFVSLWKNPGYRSKGE